MVLQVLLPSFPQGFFPGSPVQVPWPHWHRSSGGKSTPQLHSHLTTPRLCMGGTVWDMQMPAPRVLGDLDMHLDMGVSSTGRGIVDPQYQPGSPRVFPEFWAARTGLLWDQATLWESRALPMGVTMLPAQPPVSHTLNTSQNPPVNAQLVLCHEPGNDQTPPLQPAKPLPRVCHRDLPGKPGNDQTHPL